MGVHCKNVWFWLYFYSRYLLPLYIFGLTVLELIGSIQNQWQSVEFSWYFHGISLWYPMLKSGQTRRKWVFLFFQVALIDRTVYDPCRQQMSLILCPARHYTSLNRSTSPLMKAFCCKNVSSVFRMCTSRGNYPQITHKFNGYVLGFGIQWRIQWVRFARLFNDKLHFATCFWLVIWL